MLKRRASKRFVLAETGEPIAWDTTMDNAPAGAGTPTTTSPQGGYRRDSMVDGAPPQPPTLMVSQAATVTSELQAQQTSSPENSVQSPDVAYEGSTANPDSTIVVDGSRLAVVGTHTTSLIDGGSLK